MYLRRPGGQSQFSRHLRAEAQDDRFGQLQLWMLDHLDKDLSVEQLAAQANLSVRHFAREFTAHAGIAPAAFVMQIRVEEARRLIETGAVQLKEVARRCGFKDEQGLRRGFLRLLGVTPHDYRLRFTRDPYIEGQLLDTGPVGRTGGRPSRGADNRKVPVSKLQRHHE
jgi:transcriptional regulator GlxA family with amidase domain